MKLHARRIVLACVLCGGGLLSAGRAFDAEADATGPQPSPNEVRESFPTLDFEAAKLESDATPMPLADWMLVEAGNLDWVGPNGEELPLNDPHGLSSPEDVRDREFQSLPGQTFAESDPFTGDDTNFAATWNGENDLRAVRDEFVYLRFQMRSTKLFALRAE